VSWFLVQIKARQNRTNLIRFTLGLMVRRRFFLWGGASNHSDMVSTKFQAVTL
jgi:hypothetical protein